MLALYVTKPNELELRHLDGIRSPVSDEVKIKLIYGGICGSDLGVFKGKLPHANYPVRAGHELVGVVVEKGEQAAYDIGTRVVVLPNTYCGTCDLCQKGYTNICRHKQSLGINVDGGFSHEFVITSKYVLSIPDDLPDEKAVLVEPFAVVVHALQKVKIKQGMKVAIIGCGNEGMMAAVLARYLGADVTASDINPLKLETVKTMADIRTLAPSALGNESFDVVIEAAGTREAVEQAVELVAPGGHLVLIGFANEATFPVVRLVRNEVTVHGSVIYRFPDDYLQAIHYLRTMPYPIERVISCIFPVRDYQQAYELASSGNMCKVVLSFKEEEER
ncbi:zinc-dependent alcohol dehydrogenase [Geobacillus thermodenitrificans]|jgi:L-iditol 2-dehydrogenase|uniref:Sorbitol dehydrogenase (L-iditol 2-dehydrogenase) n=1 Tax=Geobacillus thermodenitrificans (strain NG80-2) TaxID=420246 RepID=A4IPQ1_GEOTN|nr:alcohol dehydrogenase catalytic domain-containing protein [Geobacillus thermodenitrificans]ABO67305.1 Sorbitol dehydrogenase (L-iditol 2-dehydrogenase) [Geobacillus thermodenitrificans NG80-2]MED0662077.1 sorbitol dehydrogenase [Geobacillus thermodenitrificans]PJW19691.1 sorbitol dehydrogenase [Geobacillus thermodenitrificans]